VLVPAVSALHGQPAEVTSKRLVLATYVAILIQLYHTNPSVIPGLLSTLQWCTMNGGRCVMTRLRSGAGVGGAAVPRLGAEPTRRTVSGGISSGGIGPDDVRDLNCNASCSALGFIGVRIVAQ
jgi:hypothetical protein